MSAASKLITHAIVASVEQRSRVVRAYKVINQQTGEPSIVTDREPLGWFLTFKDYNLALGLGDEPPPFAPGDRVRITLERVDP